MVQGGGRLRRPRRAAVRGLHRQGRLRSAVAGRRGPDRHPGAGRGHGRRGRGPGRDRRRRRRRPTPAAAPASPRRTRRPGGPGGTRCARRPGGPLPRRPGRTRRPGSADRAGRSRRVPGDDPARRHLRRAGGGRRLRRRPGSRPPVAPVRGGTPAAPAPAPSTASYPVPPTRPGRPVPGAVPGGAQAAHRPRARPGDIQGTGLGGRITRADVESVIEHGAPPAQVPSVARPPLRRLRLRCRLPGPRPGGDRPRGPRTGYHAAARGPGTGLRRRATRSCPSPTSDAARPSTWCGPRPRRPTP